MRSERSVQRVSLDYRSPRPANTRSFLLQEPGNIDLQKPYPTVAIHQPTHHSHTGHNEERLSALCPEKEFQVNSISIYNPLDKKRIIDQSKKKIRKIFNRNTLKIINVGRFVDQKDQLTLLKALNEIKNKINFNAIIIGQGVLKDKLKEFIIKNKLGNLVKLLNFKKNPYQYIVKADIFVLSSSFEGLPNVLLEALVLNKFIISSDCRTGPKEILLNGIGGDLFKVGDYKKLAELIIDYKKNKKIKLKKLKLARKNLDRFEYELNLKRYLNLVRSII